MLNEVGGVRYQVTTCQIEGCTCPSIGYFHPSIEKVQVFRGCSDHFIACLQDVKTRHMAFGFELITQRKFIGQAPVQVDPF